MTPTTLAVETDQTVEGVEYNHKTNEYRLQTNMRMICYWQSLQAPESIRPNFGILAKNRKSESRKRGIFRSNSEKDTKKNMETTCTWALVGRSPGSPLPERLTP